MYKNLYGNDYNYIYKVNEIEGLEETEYSYLLFHKLENYWMPLDEIGAELYQQIIAHNSMEAVTAYFCNKYEIPKSVFQEDTEALIETWVKRKFLSDRPDEMKEAEWMEIDYKPIDIKEYPFREIYISLSENCNLDCIYCFNKHGRKERASLKNRKPLTTEKIKDALQQFKDINGKRVIFTGGEPTLHPDIINLCEYANEIGLSASFITNGLLMDGLDFERLFSCIDGFSLSLDSIHDEELRTLWNVKDTGLSHRILETVRRIDIWSMEHNKPLTLNLMPIVTKVNMNSTKMLVEQVRDIVKSCKIVWSFTQYDKTGNEAVDYKLDVLESEYIKSTADALYSVEEDIKMRLSYAYNHSGKHAPSHTPQVMSCTPSFFIANDGTIYPCQGCEKEAFKLGNLWDSSLEEVYYSNKFEACRKKLFKKQIETCRECELLYCCSVVSRPCKEKTSADCKEQCIKRIFLDSLI